MSYDIRLKDPVTNETLEVPAHLLTGGTYAAEYDEATKTFYPKPITEAWLNITYNYSGYFGEAMKEVCGKSHGINEFNKLEASQCLPIISKMIDCIRGKYSDPVKPGSLDRIWKTRKETRAIYIDKDGKKIDGNEFLVLSITKNLDKSKYTKEEFEVEINEGDTSDYWERTAANAISALCKLKALMQLRPDGIVEVG